MITIYIVLVGVLFLLAISDLIVGVSNDAVNFLNSSIGSKVASMKVIFFVAAIGILFGAAFSSGMMEVARKGIFHPQHFYFSEIMIIFLAVMITDVILLDTFNTFGMPTSTTVSIVFELLGAAVAVSVMKLAAGEQIISVTGGGEKIAELSDYINSAKALAIISGILVSVVIAFTVGVIIQYLSRLVFSFDYEPKLKYYGAIFGGLAIASITYFIFIKGLAGTSFAGKGTDIYEYVKGHTFLIVSLSFIGWTGILALFQLLFKIDILKIVVLVGTFALAMAFAGNDLVNFIGVPLAGYQSYLSFVDSSTGADSFLMVELASAVKTPTMFLLFAGTIMVITLWTSKKARSVVKTSLDLGRQDEGYERFESFSVARSVVRSFTNVAKIIGDKLPDSFMNKIEKQFDQSYFKNQQKKLGADAPAFDKVRAAVTLVVASILIAIGTSLKLPLSTTYVTFMVAMGTSLADGAWGRESAVYRISGVLSVIGGWFFTAFSAFSGAFIVAVIFYYGGFVTIFVLVAIAAFFVIRSQFLFKKREEALAAEEDEEEEDVELLNMEQFTAKSSKRISSVLNKIEDVMVGTITGLKNEDLKKLSATYKSFEKINKKSKVYKDNVDTTISKLTEDAMERGFHYVQVVDHLREITHSTYHIIYPSLMHVDNNHKPLLPVQIEELEAIHDELSDLFKQVIFIIDTRNTSKVEMALQTMESIVSKIKKSRKSQIKRIKAGTVGTRNSMLFFNILSETKNITFDVINVLKSQRDFILDIDE